MSRDEYAPTTQHTQREVRNGLQKKMICKRLQTTIPTRDKLEH